MVEGAQSHVHADGVNLRLSDDRQQWQNAVVAEDPVRHAKAARYEGGGAGGGAGGGEGTDLSLTYSRWKFSICPALKTP